VQADPLAPRTGVALSEVVALGASGKERDRLIERSHVGFLCNLKRIVDLDAQVAHGGLNLGMAKQELYRTAAWDR
jgi:hypothetical protein